MKFGKHQLPHPWDADAEHRLLRDALERLIFASEPVATATST